MFLIVLITFGFVVAFEELKGIVEDKYIPKVQDRELERLVNESIEKGRYDILLELRITDLIHQAKEDAKKEYYAYLLLKYTQDLNLLKVYGQYMSPDTLIKLCRDELKVKSPVDRYKACFEVHKDGRFFRGIYAVMDFRDKETKRWMENKITEVKIYKEYAYHALGLLYYHTGNERTAIALLLSADRLGLSSLIKLYLRRKDYQRASEYAKRLEAYKDLSEEERQLIELVKSLR